MKITLMSPQEIAKSKLSPLGRVLELLWKEPLEALRAKWHRVKDHLSSILIDMKTNLNTGHTSKSTESSSVLPSKKKLP